MMDWSTEFVIRSIRNDDSSFESVNLSNEGLSDIEFMRKNTITKKLYVNDNCDLTDVSPLQHNTSLTYLDADDTHISDLNSLRGNTTLRTLLLDRCRVRDISFLNDTHIKELSVTYNDVGDISPLQYNTSLTRLSIGRNLITNFGPLRKNTTLRHIDINLSCEDYDGVDVNSIFHIPSLTALYAQDCAVRDVSELTHNTSLVRIDLGYNFIGEIPRLSSSIMILDLSNNAITDVSFMRGNRAITNLVLDYNRIKDLSPLQSNGTIRELCIIGNRIEDVSPLGE
jgi:hypothetical protein